MTTKNLGRLQRVPLREAWSSESNDFTPWLAQAENLKQKDTIESSLGFPLNWHNPENKAACRLSTRQDADFLNEALWPQQFDWLRQNLETMHKVFAPIVRNLKAELSGAGK